MINIVSFIDLPTYPISLILSDFDEMTLRMSWYDIQDVAPLDGQNETRHAREPMCVVVNMHICISFGYGTLSNGIRQERPFLSGARLGKQAKASQPATRLLICNYQC